ncbi:ArsR/SmtB family transcription factor [Massilia brevitalea]|uniref:ArsR/SmtB family transcription factor n=1 Tax=Massilia brevitalea TaxID=442526 RepID=UPI0027382A8C|nr:metalloregulator ArsR/SmtB family transcription factor [Massilia brevitalea]
MHTVSLDTIYRALGDPSRRAMLQRLADGRSLTVSELAAPLPLAMPTVLKHLDVLERAALVSRHKTGRTVSVTLQPAALAEALAWLQRTETFWTSRLDRLATVVGPARPNEPPASEEEPP